MTHEVSQVELQQWLRQARRGSSPAAMALWERFSPRMMSLAKEMSGASEAGDIVQGVFVALLQMPETQAKGVQDVAAYLVVATRNACVNANRARARREVAVDALSREAGGRSSGDREAKNADGLHDAMSRLEDEHREVVLLRHVGQAATSRRSARPMVPVTACDPLSPSASSGSPVCRNAIGSRPASPATRRKRRRVKKRR